MVRAHPGALFCVLYRRSFEYHLFEGFSQLSQCFSFSTKLSAARLASGLLWSVTLCLSGLQIASIHRLADCRKDNLSTLEYPAASKYCTEVLLLSTKRMPSAMAGDRTRIDCLEGNHARRYTTIAYISTTTLINIILFIYRGQLLFILSRATNTTPGEDQLEYRHLRLLDPRGLLLEIIFSVVWRIGIPEMWKSSKTVSIYKKGDTKGISNFRPISLLSTMHKIFSGALSQRITSVAADLGWLSPAQKGILPGVEVRISP